MDLNLLYEKINNSKFNYIEYFNNGKFEKKYFNELLPELKKTILFFKKNNIARGDKVAICMKDSIQWVLIDIACLLEGIITIALDVNKNYNFEDLKNKCNFKLLITSNPSAISSPFIAHPDELFNNPSFTEDDKEYVPYTYQETDTFTIISTSTSNKFIEIRKKYVGEMIANLTESFPTSTTDNFLLFLPLNVYWGRINIYSAIIYGFNITMCPAQFVFYAMKNKSPSIIMGIPVFFETIERNFMLKIKQKFIANLYFSSYRLLKKTGMGYTFKHRFKPFVALFGSNVKYMFTGSAPIKPSSVKFYFDMGLKLYEGYGMSEVGGSMICMNTPNNYKIGSVGKKFPGKEVTISETGEVLVASANMPTEYYYSELSNNVFCNNSYVATGDIGYFDKDGYLFLKGRKDDIIILKNGINVHPNEFEKIFYTLSYINSCVIFSKDTINLTVVVVIEDTTISYDKLIEDVNKLKKNSNLNLNLVKNIILTREKFSVENKLLSSNFKINRANIITKYSN